MFNFWLWILALGLCSVDLRNFGFLGGERNEAAELWQQNLVSECPQQLWGGFGLIISP